MPRFLKILNPPKKWKKRIMSDFFPLTINLKVAGLEDSADAIKCKISTSVFSLLK